MEKATQEKEKDFQEVANEYARHSIAGMRDDLDALEHARECDGTDDEGNECKRGHETKETSYGPQLEHECPEAWHDEDSARRQIDEAPLEVSVRGDWHTPGDQEAGEPTEYYILLGTGGPAARIRGELDRGQPSTAVFEYQDWFKPWTAANNLSNEETSTLLEYAQQFYFGD